MTLESCYKMVPGSSSFLGGSHFGLQMKPPNYTQITVSKSVQTFKAPATKFLGVSTLKVSMNGQPVSWYHIIVVSIIELSLYHSCEEICKHDVWMSLSALVNGPDFSSPAEETVEGSPTETKTKYTNKESCSQQEIYHRF